MSHGTLFLPTYGKKSSISKDGSTVKSPSYRVLPSGSMPTKRSLLPPLVFNGKVEYIQTFDTAERAGRAIEAARPKVLGFDIEWQVSFVAGQAPRRTATLQLCAPDRADSPEDSSTSTSTTSNDGVWSTAFIFHLCHMKLPICRAEVVGDGDLHAGRRETAGDSTLGPREGTDRIYFSDSDDSVLPDSLVRILSDPGVLLVGVGIGGDVSRLEKEYPQLRQRGVKGVVCLSEMAKRKAGPERRNRRGMWSLSDLCAEMLNLELRKPGDIRTSNWEKRPLSVDQLFYAAADAYAGLRLWQEMQKMPDAVSGSKGPLGHQSRVNGDDDVGGRPANSTRPPSSKLETHRLWHEDGLSVEAIAEVRSNKTSTVLGYLSDCIEAGLPYVWERFNINPETEAVITRALLTLIMKGSSGNDHAQRPFEGATEAVRIVPKENSVGIDGDISSRDQTRNGAGVESTTSCWSTQRSSSVLRQCRDRQERERLLESVRLKDVKELVPNADYWQIRLVLARCKLEGSPSFA